MKGVGWNDLRVVLAVSRHGSLVAAARALAVDESTVARRLTAAEDRLGTRLVSRTPSGVALTAEGRALVKRLQRAELEIEAGIRATAGSDSRVSGTVRITAVPVVAEHVLAPALPTLLDMEPALSVELVADKATLSVVQRQVDIAIRLARPTVDYSALTRRIGVVR